jgi:hypothetical protein
MRPGARGFGFSDASRGLARAARAACWLWLGLAGGLFLAGCQSTKAKGDFAPTYPRFYLEAADGRGLAVTLPQSGVRLSLNAQPVLTEGDVVNVELAQVELGKCLLFQLTSAAARDLYRLTASHQGRRLALFINGAPLGARRIEGPWSNGAVLVFAELPEEALPSLVADLRKSCAALQRELAKK